MKKKSLFCLLAFVLSIALAGCSALPGGAGTASVAAVTASGKTGRGHSWNSGEPKYTKADYDLALSFQTEGYENESVEAFDRKVLDWEDETAYHKTEEALERLSASLPEDDPHYEFITRTLFNSWHECEKRHYNACAQNSAPWYNGWVKTETMGSIFGDEVVLTGGYADFDFNYSIPDGTALTVGERDGLLHRIETGMEEFLGKQSQDALAKQEAMEKTLEAELKRQLEHWGGGLNWEGKATLSYWWEQSWDADTATDVVEGGSAWNDDAFGQYTKEDYDLVVSTLKFDGYKTMSIAEFNRKIHALLDGYDSMDSENREKFLLAYEKVTSSLKESDSNYAFFRETVPNSENEYEARAREVFSGKPADPEVEDYCYAELQEDVFGDQVSVGGAEASYRFTYRILDENRLTVKERDSFLAAVKQSAKDVLQKALREGNGTVNKDSFQKELEEAGKATGTGNIRFTGCEVESCEVLR